MIGRAVTGGRGTALSFPCRQYNGWLARLAKANLTEDLHEQIRGLWNYRATPQNATYKNANNIYIFQRITSLLLHIIFSFCMIIPQSFHFVGQIVQLLCSLQNVFQMTHLALQAHLQAAREVVNDTSTFNYPGVIAVFKSPIVWGLFSYTKSPSDNPKGKNLGGLNRMSVTPTQCRTSYC